MTLKAYKKNGNLKLFCKKKLSWLVLFSLIYIPIVSSMNILPYDTTCSDKEIIRAEALTNDIPITEAGFCENCENNSSGLDDLYNTFIPEIPRQCFLAMALNGSKLFDGDQYVHCESKGSSKITPHRKLCVNKNYIHAIYTAWKDVTKCFNYSLERKIETFHLINHESRGLLNIKSDTGARCLGQLTTIYVRGINQGIKRWEPLYREVIQRCPDLREKTFQDMNFITCKTTSDPYTCLFYTIYGFEKNHRLMEETFKSQSEYINLSQFPEDIRKKYKLPIRLNELLHIEGFTKDGKPINWLIWDDIELYNLYTQIDDSKGLQVKKVPIFEHQEDIEIMFNYWSHNGGESLSKASLKARVETIKKSVSKTCSPDDSYQLRCKGRNQIIEGGGLDSLLAMELFGNDITRNYQSGSYRRRQEVGNFVKNVLASSKAVFDSGDRLWNVRLPHLSYREQMDFQEEISYVCPQLRFQ